MVVSSNSIDLVGNPRHLGSVEGINSIFLINLLIIFLYGCKNNGRLAWINNHHIRFSFQGGVTYLKPLLFEQLFLLLFVHSVPHARYYGENENPDSCSNCRCDQCALVDFIIVVAICVLSITIWVPIWAVPVVVAALPRTALVCAVLVISHKYYRQ